MAQRSIGLVAIAIANATSSVARSAPRARDLKWDNIVCQGLPAPGRVCAGPAAGPQEHAR